MFRHTVPTGLSTELSRYVQLDFQYWRKVTAKEKKGCVCRSLLGHNETEHSNVKANSSCDEVRHSVHRQCAFFS